VRLGLTNYLIGATDVGALEGLQAWGLPCFSMRTNLPGVEWDWGSPSFKALGQHKVALIHKALTWRLEVLITDSDALVLREPFAYMARWHADFLTTSDCLGNTTGSRDGGLEDTGCLGQAFNIGYMYFSPCLTPTTAHHTALLLRALPHAIGNPLRTPTLRRRCLGSPPPRPAHAHPPPQMSRRYRS
jgi:hypothetical protein